ncbi:aspartate 1-decarboxylase [Bacillus pseudomycoides]|uniref:Aspartate 1-decarboxylase n=1 Tax=Bacillus pseudomycoides TaxID=64104 RepID=A0A2B5RV75_9BACI|nr:aspartate 1-decarboxylase [Bacillus pseudomycoides]PEA82341.1 aspartate 1-decarboxylase [Bacillus pseudomycoides]PED73221.1 aspartate 1-decarboxylase [Bacillus pseudomycoides]PEI43672.1 aspartate 1-decarboxylase [Bacillus pseudomycoides]PEI86952.1 aspartate 1-decarboxylase [Bacillus pseudomycoides]PEJ27567.1 aspartate 1-decarboxylase [Bacillus pseudomycoides]
MFRTMMKSKLHKATVTEANLNYVGSITIDSNLLKTVDMLPNEKVQVVNNNNGARIETYIIEGEPGSGVICVNGAAARLFQPGDKVIIISYAMLAEEKVSEHTPVVAVLDENNKVAQIITEKQAVVL